MTPLPANQRLPVPAQATLEIAVKTEITAIFMCCVYAGCIEATGSRSFSTVATAVAGYGGSCLLGIVRPKAYTIFTTVITALAADYLNQHDQV